MTSSGSRTPRDRRRLWVVSELYAPEETSTGYVLTRIAEALVADFDVRVLCGQPTYSRRGVRAPVREIRNGVAVRRCAGTTLDKNLLAGRLMNLATVGTSMFVNAARKFRRDDVVLVVTTPPLLPFLTLLAAKLRGARCVLLVHDVYPDVMVATGMIRRGSIAHTIGAALNRWLYRFVAQLIVLGRDMAALARGKMPQDRWHRIAIIPNWADVDDIRPEPKALNPLLAELGLEHSFVVQYAGNMGRPNDLDVIVGAADRLRDSTGIHFVVLGGGARRARLEADVARLGLHNVTMLPPRPRSEQHVFLNACDVALISLVSGMQGVGVPSRLYNTLAAGRPVIVISDEGAEPALAIREIGAGWVVRPGDVDGLVTAITDARSNPRRLNEMGARARRAAEEQYSFPRILDEYRTLLHGLEAARSEPARAY